MHVSDLSPNAQKLFQLIEFDPDEELIGEIRKHPIGLFLIYLTGVLVACGFLFLLVIGPVYLGRDPFGLGLDINSFRLISMILGGFLTILTVIFTAIGAYLYVNNVMLVTSEKIAQILYRNIFDRKISQLSIGDVQDVTVEQNGIIAQFFNYGKIVIETAGEQDNYEFTLAPKPYDSAKLIVGAHERNLKQFGN